MCDIDYQDGASTVLQNTSPVARKVHICGECHRPIYRGEKYFREVLLFDAKLVTCKSCAHCQIPIRWITMACGGYINGTVKNEFIEHAYREGYAVKRVAVSMRNQWRRNDGTLMPIPNVIWP